MINRGLQKKSQYIFNAKTGMLEKKEENAQTIESLSKQAKKYIKNLDKIGEKVNEATEKGQPINQITVITAQDNLTHNYFYDFEYSWDSTNCLSPATIKMPKLNEENINYWSTYQGTLTIYGGYNLMLDKVNKANKSESEQEVANMMAELGINSDIKPFFRGTVSRIKEYQTYIVLHLDNIGVRFKQKIPDQFRQSFINNQNVRDAFQAICEFLGVEFICPPQTVDATATNTLGTNGTENDVSSQQSTIKNIADTAKNKIKESSQSSTDDKNNDTQINQQEILSNTQNTANKNSNTPTPNDTTGTNTNAQNTTDPNALTDNKEIDVQLNGFADINFDANGAIVHGSTAIETSPDMADTLTAMEENPLEKYTEDETGIVEKVQKFLDGDMFEELHNSVMDYGAITIQPKSTSTSNISSSGVGNTNTSGNTDENSEEGSGHNPKAWTAMARVVNKYFKPEANHNTLITDFRACGANWSCLAEKYEHHKVWSTASDVNYVIREMMAANQTSW